MSPRSMSPRAALAAFLCISQVMGQSAEPSEVQEQVDQMDAGDQWVDSSEDLSWYSSTGQLLVNEPGAFKLDLVAGHRSGVWQRARSSAVDAGGTSGTSGTWDSELYAMATLQVPWEGLLSRGSRKLPRDFTSAPRLAALEPADHDEPEPDVEREREPEASRVAASGGREEGSAPTDDGDAGQRVPEERVQKEQQTDDMVAVAPGLILLVAREIAARVGGSEQGADLRLKSLVRRSRISGLSPELRLRGVLGFDRTTSTEDTVGIYPGDTTTRGARDSLAEVRLTFRLDRLVLGDGEDSLERQRAQLMSSRRKLVVEAVELFMEWRLSSARSKDASLPPDDRLKAQVKADAALAQLHLMTGGWFQGAKTLGQLALELPSLAEDD